MWDLWIAKIKGFFNRWINKIVFFFSYKHKKEEIIIEHKDLPCGIFFIPKNAPHSSSFVIIRQSLPPHPNRKPSKKEVINKVNVDTLRRLSPKDNNFIPLRSNFSPLSMAKHIMSHRMYNY